MTKLASALSMLVALTATCTSVAAETTNTPLTFYLVTKQKIENGKLFDAFPFPNLGYISSRPDLTIERLKDLSSLPESMRPGLAANREEGTLKKITMVTRERFFFTLHAEDAARLRGVVENAGPQNQLVLILIGDKAINLLRAEDIPATSQFEVMSNWRPTKVNEIAGSLKNLIQ
jgi:hypothetical protein